MARGGLNYQTQPLYRQGCVVGVVSEEKQIMHALWHWFAALGEVYTRHASRHGPDRLLPAKVLPTRGARQGTPKALVPTKARQSTPRQDRTLEGSMC